MSRHTFKIGAWHEDASLSANGVLRVVDFVPYGDSTLDAPVSVEFRLGASYPWAPANKSATGSIYSIILVAPLATNNADVAFTLEVRFNGGTDGQWTVCAGTIYAHENAPRETSISGLDVVMKAEFTMTLTDLIASVFKDHGFPLSAYPLDVGVDGGLLVGADSTNPSEDGARTKTFSSFLSPSALEIHRDGTGINGTSLLQDFTSILTDNTLVAPNPDFNVSATIQNPTSSGASDGAIDQTITGGVGGFTFLWTDDLSTTEDRTGLLAGLYECQITDSGNPTNIKTVQYEVIDPAVAADLYKDTFVESSPISPIRFKQNEGTVDDVSVLKTGDNVNYCEASPEEWNTPPYYEIFNSQDTAYLQFRSDFEVNALVATKDDGTIVQIPLTVAIDNINTFEQNTGVIRDGGSGTLKVYASSEFHPEGTKAGELIVIDTGAGGGTYNGEYEIQDIIYDATLAQEYLLINGTFGVVENVDIKYIGAIRYNVLEASVSMATLAAGIWRLTFNADQGGADKSLISEWIKIQASTPNMFLLTYKNDDNAFKVEWSTGIEMSLRVFGMFTSSAPTRDVSLHRNSNDTPSVLNAYVRRQRNAMFHRLPWFAVERLALIVSCDTFKVNGVEYLAEEVPETDTPDRYALSKASVVLEEVAWLQEQNTHDVGDSATQEVSVIGANGEEVLGI